MKKRVIINTQDYLVDSVVGFIRTVMIRGRTPYCSGILVSYNEKKNQHTIEIKYKKSILFINIINEQKMNCLLMKEVPMLILKEDDFPIAQMKPKIGNIILKMLAVDQDQYEAYRQNIRVYSNNMYRSIFAAPSAEQPIMAERPARTTNNIFYNLFNQGFYSVAATTTSLNMEEIRTRSYSPGMVHITFDHATMPSSTATTVSVVAPTPSPTLSIDDLDAAINNLSTCLRRNNNNDEF